MKQRITYLCLLLSLITRAQQTMLYTQYLFNKAGVNPAAAGADINQKYNYVLGINRQWVGFENAPRENFVNFSMTIRPPRSYHMWQNVGVYIDNQESGILNSNGFYANYTVHLLITKKWVASVGVYVGLRTFFISPGDLDRNDPINQTSTFKTLMYPDIMPGFRLSNKKLFFDVSARQLSITRLKDFNGHRIGSPSTLNPTLFADIGTRIPLSDVFMVMPSAAINAAVIGIPTVDVNVMAYYMSTFGAGLALRNANFLSIICQLKILKNFSAGLAYSYSLNAARYAAPNSFEIMIGVTPFGMDDKPSGKHSIAKCPALDF